jgi:queuine tRNA-ribosyltransferase
MTAQAGRLGFTLLAEEGLARRGRFHTAHGPVDTPAFMAVGTQASVKCVTPAQVAETGTQVVLANTYHMGLGQRSQLVERFGGLHEFMRWSGSILTDSGGFQVFSLPDRQVDDEGVTFSYAEGGEQVRLTAEASMAIQRQLGADIVMAFDECVEHTAERKYLERSLERTHAWLRRCAACELHPHQHLFGIVQGGIDPALRTRSVQEVCAVELPGYAIGGVSVGEGHALLKQVVEHTAPQLPGDRPRYLMGVGLPEDLVESVARGVDMFDCVIPTRYAREGTLFTWQGRMRIKDKKYRKDRYPIDTACACQVCSQGFSRAYLRHLLFAGEPLGETLLTIHNLQFYQDLMRRMREAIEAGTFASLRRSVLEQYTPKA